MKTATVADLRNPFRGVSAWIESGKTVESVKCGRPFAHLLAPASAEKSMPAVDGTAQPGTIWGARVFNTADVEAVEAVEQEQEDSNASQPCAHGTASQNSSLSTPAMAADRKRPC